MNSGIAQLVWQHMLQIAVVFSLVLLLVALFAKNRPHLAHALWSVVLIKGAVVPWLVLPTSLFFWFPIGTTTPAPQPRTVTTVVSVHTPSGQTPDPLALDSLNPPPETATYTQLSKPQQRAETSNTNDKLTSWLSLPIPILSAAWLAIAVVRVLWTMNRIQNLKQLAARTSLPESHPSYQLAQVQLQECLEQVMPRHPLRRFLRVMVVEAEIGPAVVGLFQPKIILPAHLVAQCDANALRPILMHELIHIRRLDLFWGLLQLFTTSLWWFNPLMHYASRRLDQETERCVDEETVAALHHKPLLYARSMLLVLQTRNPSPASVTFSGTRAMEFNAERMKRIMSLKTKAHARTPRSILVLMAAAILLAVPGGTSAQTVATPQPSNSTEASTEPPQQLQVETLVTYDVAETLAKLRVEESAEESRESLQQLVVASILKTVHQNQPMSPEQWAASAKAFAKKVQLQEDKKLIVKATPVQHESVKETIQHLNRFGSTPLALTTKIISISKKNFEKLDLTWSIRVEKPENIPGTNAAAIQPFSPPILVTDLDAKQTDEAVTRMLSNKSDSCLSAPKLVVHNGQKATIFTGSERAYAADFVKRANVELNLEDAYLVAEGMSIDCTPELIDDKIKLNMLVSLSKVEDVAQVSFRTNSKNGVTTASLEVPKVSNIRFAFGETPLPAGRSLLVATFDPNEKDRMLVIVATCQKTSR